MLDRSGGMAAPTQEVTRWLVALWGGDRVFDRDRVVVAADEHFAHDEAQDALALSDLDAVRALVQPLEEALERVGELEVGGGVVELCLERVELGLECRFARAQHRHACAQLLEREQRLLVGVEQARAGGSDALQLARERVFALVGRVGLAQRLQAAFQLAADACGLGEQLSQLDPDEFVELVGADRPAAADAAADVTVVVGADAAVVVERALARLRRRAVAGVAALAADEDALQQRRLFRAARGEALVVVQPRLGELELLAAHQRRHRHERPLLRRPVAPGCAAAVALAALPACPGRLAVAAARLRLAERGFAAVGRVAQDPPDARAVPDCLAGAGRDPLAAQAGGDLGDRLARLAVAAEDLAHDRRLALVDLVEGLVQLALSPVAVAVGRTGEHRLRAQARPVQLAAAGALGDLRALVLGNHPLELAQKLILGRAGALRLLREADADTGAVELLEQQHLVGVAAREPVGRVAEHELEAALRGAVAQPLQRRPRQRRSGDAVVAEDELLRDEQAALGRQLTQRRELTRDRRLLALTLRRHARVDRCHPHLPVLTVAQRLPPLVCHPGSAAAAPGQAARRPARAAPARADRRRTRPQPALPPRRSPSTWSR